MRELGGCGHRLEEPDHALACVRCGAPCCRACAFSLDEAPHCRRCTEVVLDAQGASLELRASLGGPDGAERRRRGDGRRPWLILVAREEHGLYAHLMRAFARDDKVDVILDRRRDVTRNPPGMAERLRTHGAAVIRRSVARPS